MWDMATPLGWKGWRQKEYLKLWGNDDSDTQRLEGCVADTLQFRDYFIRWDRRSFHELCLSSTVLISWYEACAQTRLWTRSKFFVRWPSAYGLLCMTLYAAYYHLYRLLFYEILGGNFIYGDEFKISQWTLDSAALKHTWSYNQCWNICEVL